MPSGGEYGDEHEHGARTAATSGFSFDPQFTDDKATRMIINDETSVMLAEESFFQGFVAPQAIADTATSREVIVAVSAESRNEVDDLAQRRSLPVDRTSARPRTTASCICAGS